MLPVLSVSIGDYEICTKAQIDLEFVDLQELYFLLYTCKIQPVRKFLPGLKNVIENVENQLRIDDKITRKKKLDRVGIKQQVTAQIELFFSIKLICFFNLSFFQRSSESINAKYGE